MNLKKNDIIAWKTGHDELIVGVVVNCDAMFINIKYANGDKTEKGEHKIGYGTDYKISPYWAKSVWLFGDHNEIMMNTYLESCIDIPDDRYFELQKIRDLISKEEESEPMLKKNDIVAVVCNVKYPPEFNLFVGLHSFSINKFILLSNVNGTKGRYRNSVFCLDDSIHKKIPDWADIVYSYKNDNSKIIIDYGIILSENDSYLEISLNANKRLLHKHGNEYSIIDDIMESREAKIFKLDKLNNPFPTVIASSTIPEDTILMTGGFGLPLPKSGLIKNIFRKEEQKMFNICGYEEEIASTVEGKSVYEKRQIGKKLEKNQDGINSRINSRFWEEGKIPDAKAVLDILKELEKEENKK